MLSVHLHVSLPPSLPLALSPSRVHLSVSLPHFHTHTHASKGEPGCAVRFERIDDDEEEEPLNRGDKERRNVYDDIYLYKVYIYIYIYMTNI